MRKFSNRILLIALIALIGIFTLSRFFRSPKLESNLTKELVRLDTSQIDEVRIIPEGTEGVELKLIRNGKSWKILGEQKEATVEHGTVASMLGVAMNLQAQRLVTRKKEKWETFGVGEKSTRVSVYDGSEKLADFRVGKTGFAQGQQGMGIAGAYTYIRLTNEDEVYSSEGFIGSHFNRSFNEWRDKTFLRIKKENVAKIEFNYPDSSFVLEKRDSVWFVGNGMASESKITQYFNKISFKNISEFEEEFFESGQALLSFQIIGTDGSLITAKAWPKNESKWILSSSLQEGIYFSGNATLIHDVFPGMNWFNSP